MTGQEQVWESSCIDYAEAMERFGGNRELYERLALRYLDDPNFNALEAALRAGDAESAYRHAHTLKGVAGNLSFGPLYAAACRITQALRAGDIAAAHALAIPLREAQASLTAALFRLKRESERMGAF